MPQKRRKHVPLRTCVACRQQRAKRELVRIVRTPEGMIEIDPRGKQSGRGAYLCPDSQCWEAAVKTGILGRALKCEVTAEQVAELRAKAGEILDRIPPGEAAAPAESRTTGSRGMGA
jgi:predicted RNA-binding protein YlxR (DUF448 family)